MRPIEVRRASTSPGSSSGASSSVAAQLVVVEEPVGHVELGLDVGLRACRADDSRVALGAEEQADGLGQDRLAGARLARDRRQPRPGYQLAVADEDEVLDPEATKRRSGCSG